MTDLNMLRAVLHNDGGQDDELGQLDLGLIMRRGRWVRRLRRLTAVGAVTAVGALALLGALVLGDAPHTPPRPGISPHPAAPDHTVLPTPTPTATRLGPDLPATTPPDGSLMTPTTPPQAVAIRLDQ